MRAVKYLTVATLSFAMSFGALNAQSLSSNNGPAEIPPASYKGNQYVDSKGCVYIRAGFSGRVNWVPRVTRKRELMCGFRPTLGKTQTASATRPAPNTTKQTVRTVKPARNAQPLKTTTAATPTVKKTTSRVVRQAKPAPKAAPQKATRVARKPTPAARQAGGGCAGVASTFSSKYVNQGARCGPQTGNARNVVRQEVSPQSSNGRQRVGPKGVNRRIAESRIPLPKGYKAAWTDGRLNPLSGTGTSSGKSQMQLVWSDTVPRKLIDPRTGKPATRRQIRLFRQ